MALSLNRKIFFCYHFPLRAAIYTIRNSTLRSRHIHSALAHIRIYIDTYICTYILTYILLQLLLLLIIIIMIIIMIIIINNDTDNDLSRIYIKKSVKNVVLE